MNGNERNDFALIMMSTILRTMRNKGNEYSVDGDVNGNFKRVAADTDDTVLRVWNSYFSKHLDSLRNYVKDPTKPVTEDIRGRIGDMIAYLIILGSLQEEGVVPVPPLIDQGPYPREGE